MIGAYLSHIDDEFAEKKTAVGDLVRNLAIEHGSPQCLVNVNMADDPRSGAIYLTVTGTSSGGRR